MSIPYNFRPILSAISDMQYEYESRQQVTNKTLQPFRKELNKFFTDSNCVEIILLMTNYSLVCLYIL